VKTELVTAASGDLHFLHLMYLPFRLSLMLLLLATASIAQQRGTQQASLNRAQTREAERRLSDLGYWTGAIDGLFDPATQSALIAFQKWEGRPINGQLNIDELEAIRNSAVPKARDLGYAHVEVDLDRQVLLVVNDNDAVRVLPISTGNDKLFVDEGQESVAHTPRGRFVVYDKEFGWHTGSLGAIYYANFISGGVAIHGSRNVPTQPASHGCIRVPMFAAREVSKLLPVGTIVLVYDKVSFVSAKEWIENPKLKQAGMLISAADDDLNHANAIKPRSRSLAIKKARSRIIRAD
jgi:peptidoglycan hydrolase-like protein with peptidoglycan-binding domain